MGKKVLIVVDMQKDFVTGVLGTKEAQTIVPNVANKINEYIVSGDEIIFTRDTHDEDYMDTMEGKKLPVPHCIKGSEGWKIIPEINVPTTTKIFNKPTFGSIQLSEYVSELNPDEIEVIGVCTGICVISNVLLLKANLPNTKIVVDSNCCACVTPESHKTALDAMKLCHIDIV